MRFLSLRALFLLAFVVGMPVLALPPVARWLDEAIHGPPPVDFGQPPAAAAREAGQPLVAEGVVPAGYLAGNPATASGPAGLDSAAAAAPPIAPAPVFAPLAPPVATAREQTVDAATLERLQQIRLRLEELGAEYVVVEALERTNGYRCRCRMLVDPRSRFLRPFEASANDPLAAAEQVLNEVQAWRLAGVENRAKPQ